MFRPILWVEPPLTAQYGVFYLPAVWGFGSLFSGLLLGPTLVVFWVGRMIVGLLRIGAGEVASDPPNPGRRRFLQARVGGIASVPFILSGYGATVEAETPQVREFKNSVCPLALRCVWSSSPISTPVFS